MTAFKEARTSGFGRWATAWIRHHPIAAFLAWFFSIGWAIAFIPAVARHAFQLDLPVQPFIVASTLLGLLLPAVVITRIAEGPEAVSKLRERLVTWRAALGWYVFALLAVPATATVLAIILMGPPDATVSTVVAAVVGGLVLQAAIGLITVNLWEEAAWMGFVQRRLQHSHGVLLAAALTAVLFVLQHVPLLIENGAGLLLILPVMIVLAVPFRAYLAWMYNRTNSLFLVGLMHAVGNAVATAAGFGMAFLPRLYPGEEVGLIPFLASAVVGLAVIAGTAARLGRGGR